MIFVCLQTNLIIFRNKIFNLEPILKIELNHNGKKYEVDLSSPIDISIAYEPQNGVKCFFAPEVIFSPFTMDNWVGSVREGSPVNYYNIQLNPHGNGTHTECLGHITSDQESVNSCLKRFHFVAELISLEPKKIDSGDSIIDLELIQNRFSNTEKVPALVIRTLPNSERKLHTDYTATNPPYISSEAMEYLVSLGIEHLLVDLPSVDKEIDDGMLASHKIFWQTLTTQARKEATITELIYVPSETQDGLYFLNLQIAPLELDASPSKPVLFKLIENE